MEAGGSESREKAVKAEVGVTQSGAKEFQQPLEAENGKEMDSPLRQSLQEEPALLTF